MAVTAMFYIDGKLTAKRKGESSILVLTHKIEVDADHTSQEVLALTFSTGATQALTLPVLRARNLDDNRYVCVEKTCKQIDWRVWEVESTYAAKLFTNKYTSNPNEGGQPFWTLSRRCSLKMMDYYVQPSTYPTNGDTNWPPSSTIAGTKIDRFGQPMKIGVPHHEIFLTTQIDRAWARNAGGAKWDLITYLGIDQYLGYRNSDVFLNYPIGSVVLLGYDDQPTDDPWQSITLRMAANDDFHLEQVWLPGADGRQLLSTVTTWATKTIKQLDSAFFYQPYPLKTSFNAFDITGGNFSEIVNPTPAW